MPSGEVVVAQLVERLLPIPEVRSSNPVIGKIYIEHFVYLFTINSIEKTKINKKRPGRAHFKKSISCQCVGQQFTKPGADVIQFGFE